ncbi:membrane transporter [Oryctes borbonicus]|uniref:Membrane transporter n=1 Tax=Oryctes borbonicus TaxID=1629725 RepID=A0A0T6ASN5_9SCAR|nr:membrane transporter [Oryctes borbonicus]
MLTGWRKTLSRLFIIPQRYVLGIMAFLAVVNAYTMRTALSVAITEMVLPTSSEASEDVCFVNDTAEDSSSSTNNNLYDWDETTQGLILSSFYWGYVLTHIPGGIMAERYGGKYSLGLGILSTAIFTLITPLFVDYGYGWLVVLRVCVGFGEGTTFPAINALLGKWVPHHERGKIGTLAFAGSQVGTILANAVSGVVIHATESWASVFYLFGSLGVLWFILFTLLCYSDPESHPFITEKEKNYLRKELSNSVSNKDKKIPWKQILTSTPLWALVVAQIGHDWGFFAMVTDLPKYMSGVLKFKVKESGLWSSLPYVVMWIVSLSSGWFCDYIIKRGYMGITFARKFFTAIAAIGPGIFMLAASYAGCDRNLVIAMFTIAMGFMGTFYCGMKVNALDLAANYAGTLMAIVNGIGALSGIITPYLIGALTEDQTLTQWRTVFWITMGVFVVTTIVYVLFASGEEQWWNRPDHPNFGVNVEKGIEAEKSEKESKINDETNKF